MKFTIEITDDDIQQAIKKAVVNFISIRIEDELRESNELWDTIENQVLGFVQSQEASQLVDEAIEENKSVVTDLIKRKLNKVFV